MDEKILRGRPQSQQAGYIWKFLDELAQSDPEKYNQFIKNTLEDGEKQGLGPPAHCFVIHSTKVPKIIPVRDFFINACKWNQVPPPKSDDDPIKIIASELREELIKGEICYTIDVAVNPNVVSQCLQKKEEKEMLIELLIRYVEETASVRLERAYKMIENDYSGNKDNLLDLMCPDALKQSINELSGAMTEEKLICQLKDAKLENKLTTNVDLGNTDERKVNDILLPSQVESKNDLFLNETTVTKASGMSSNDMRRKRVDAERAKGKVQTTARLKEPSYFERSEAQGEDKYQVVEINLPGVLEIRGCELDIGDDFLKLLVPGKYQLFLELKKKIDDERTKAYFARKNSMLVVRMKEL